MITKVYKYPIDMVEVTELTMPVGAQILAVQTQHGGPCLWARVDPAAKTVVRRFRIYGTGHVINSNDEPLYIDTFQTNSGAFVWHVFEITEVKP